MGFRFPVNHFLQRAAVPRAGSRYLDGEDESEDRMKTAGFAAIVTLLAMPTLADVVVEFADGAPKDRFAVTNTGDCPLADVQIVLDLGAAPSGLIFDVTGQGAGVSVFQPLEIVAGQEFLTRVPEVRDGDNQLTLDVTGLAPGAAIAFTIDVDDTGGVSETRVSGSEIAGARAYVSPGPGTAFGENGVARITYSSCSA